MPAFAEDKELKIEGASIIFVFYFIYKECPLTNCMKKGLEIHWLIVDGLQTAFNISLALHLFGYNFVGCVSGLYFHHFFVTLIPQ